MWDNLTLKQKAEVMKLAVQQGISDLDSIRDLYNTSVNTFSVGGPKNNKKKSSGYSPSTSIKKRVTQWEGASMHSPAPDTGKVNRSFDDEAKDFNAVNRSLPGFNALPQASKDALFSYSYNVGVGNYKNRVHPVLKKFLMGQATVEDVQNSMWASKDSDPRMSGLRRRRAAERNLFAEGLGQDGVAYTSDDIPEEITWENYKKRQAAQNMHILNDRMNTINKSFTSATSAPTIIVPDLSNQFEIKDEDYLIKDTPKQNRGIDVLSAIKYITQGPGALLNSVTPASSSNSLLGFLSPIKFDKGGPKITQQDLDRNNWRWATRNELQEDDPLINTLGDNDKWIVNSEGRLVPTSEVNKWLNSYERQTPYQEQNDITTAKEASHHKLLDWLTDNQKYYLSNAVMASIWRGRLLTESERHMLDRGHPMGGPAQATYLLPRDIQEDKFLEQGYLRGKEGDYGLVKKAVGERNLPVYQRTPDDVSRDDLILIGNTSEHPELGRLVNFRESDDLQHAESYPAAVYFNPKDENFYVKAWDLNDYGGGSGTSGRYNLFKRAAADFLDIIGSPVVVTTGYKKYNTDALERPLDIIAVDPEVRQTVEKALGLHYYRDDSLKDRNIPLWHIPGFFGGPEIEVTN